MKMKKLIIGLAVLLVVGGGAAYLLTKDRDKDNQQNSSQQAGGNGDSSGFAPVSTKGIDFSATVTTTDQNGNTTNGVFEQDSDKTRFVTTQNGEQAEFIYTADAYYTCSGGQCFKFPASQSANTGVDTGLYEYDESELSAYRNGAAYQGKKSCSTGECDVWSVSSEGTTSTLYVDAKTKRIAQVEGTVNGSTTKIVYEYKNVTINVPANAQSLPTGQ